MARAFTPTSYLQRADPTGINPNAAFTLGFWLWVNSYSLNGRGLFHLGIAGDPSDASARGLFFFVDFSGKLRAKFLGGTGNTGVTAVGTGAWVRVGLTKTAAGISNTTLVLNGVADNTVNTADPGALVAGDVIRFSESDPVTTGVDHLDGKIAWPFWLQGVELSPAALDDYLNQTNGKTICSLKTDYGPSGAITPNALKGLWPFQSATPGEDISGVGNTLTNTSTTDVADPTGLPASCGAAILTQTHHRFYAQGSESGAVALSAEDGAATVLPNAPFQYRDQIDLTNGPVTKRFSTRFAPAGTTNWMPLEPRKRLGS